MPLPPLPASLGKPVTTRQYSLYEMVVREWGSEFNAPDHGVYVFGGGSRRFDSTDMGQTGIYSKSFGQWTADSAGVRADSVVFTADGLNTDGPA